METKIQSKVFLMDCYEYMRNIPDKFFDLCIADPPYGISINESIGRRKGNKHSGRKKAYWDNRPISRLYLQEIFRVSCNQIIWGANHFMNNMPVKNATCWLLWDKKFSDSVSFSQFEMAWTSYKGTTKKFDRSPTTNEYKFHPTQKPIALYAWILDNYATGAMKIFDPFLGSGSSRIAAYKKGYDFYACEIDKDYYDAQEERFRKECFGEIKTPKGEVIKQLTLFE